MNSAITVVYKVNNEQRHLKYIVEFSRNLKYFLKIPRVTKTLFFPGFPGLSEPYQRSALFYRTKMKTETSLWKRRFRFPEPFLKNQN